MKKKEQAIVLFKKYVLEQQTGETLVCCSTQQAYKDKQEIQNLYGGETPDQTFNKEVHANYESQGLVRIIVERNRYYYTPASMLNKFGNRTMSNPIFSVGSDSKNRIIYGAPGTGKSWRLKAQCKTKFKPENQRRITFYPDYSYAQFVGCYRPSPVYNQKDKQDLVNFAGRDEGVLGTPLIDYQFVPGPFLDMLAKAMSQPTEDFVLIIEEINRAETAAVFGDVFQSLDRGEDGSSEYPISLSTEAMAWLKKNIGSDENNHVSEGVNIPENLYLWATMNSADQGVFLLDAAFKRRWSFEYLALDTGSDVIKDWKINLGGTCHAFYKWNCVRTAINEHLVKIIPGIPEDRLIGPFFMKNQELKDRNAVKNKLFLYLKDDVLRHGGLEKFFTETTFSKILAKFDGDGVDCFDHDLKTKIEKCQCSDESSTKVSEGDEESVSDQAEGATSSNDGDESKQSTDK